MFTTLANFRSLILPNEDLQTDTRYDAVLQALGKGVAAVMERWCNRQLGRVVGDQYTTAADNCIVSLPRFPVEEVTAIDVRDAQASDWIDQPLADALGRVNERSGLVILTGQLGNFYGSLRITYTGGYWFDTEGGQTQPEGSEALPDDIFQAWLEQCRAVWESYDHTGAAMIDAQRVSRMATLDLIPSVQTALRTYRRL